MSDLLLERRISFCFIVGPLPLLYFLSVSFLLGHAVAQLVEASRYKQVRFPMVSLEFFIDIILPVAQWSRGGLSL